MKNYIGPPNPLHPSSLPVDKPRFFVACVGNPVVKHFDQFWTRYEVGDNKSRKRICLTSSSENAVLIRDALNAFTASREQF